MKVEEAKKKVCPFMQSVNIYSHSGLMVDAGIYQNNKNKSANINCICGGCMAWEYDWILDGSGNEPPEDEKEGHCKRIGQ